MCVQARLKASGCSIQNANERRTQYLEHLVDEGVVIRASQHRDQVFPRNEAGAVHVQPLKSLFQTLLLRSLVFFPKEKTKTFVFESTQAAYNQK